MSSFSKQMCGIPISCYSICLSSNAHSILILLSLHMYVHNIIKQSGTPFLLKAFPSQVFLWTGEKHFPHSFLNAFVALSSIDISNVWVDP